MEVVPELFNVMQFLATLFPVAMSTHINMLLLFLCGPWWVGGLKCCTTLWISSGLTYAVFHFLFRPSCRPPNSINKQSKAISLLLSSSFLILLLFCGEHQSRTVSRKALRGNQDGILSERSRTVHKTANCSDKVKRLNSRGNTKWDVYNRHDKVF